MAATERQNSSTSTPLRLNRRMRLALAVSAGVHVCAVGVLALVQMAVEPADAKPMADLAIVESAEPGPTFEPVAMSLEPAEDLAEGGSSFETSAVAIATGGGPQLEIASPWIGPGAPDGSSIGGDRPLGERVSPLGGGGNGGGSRGSGEGNGIGNGVGDGTGTSFFGLTAQGQKFVFVVDASSSMRRPSFGPERTLFNRVKLEIMRSVRLMTEQQRFYIVFFNDSFLPMPSKSLVTADKDSQAYYLRWMSRVESGGPTDPERALQLALGLQPDVIYFLTDGEFKRGLVKRIDEMNRAGVVIHTINYGSDEDESETLREIAEQNGGTYYFVPLPTPPQETAARTSRTRTSATP